MAFALVALAQLQAAERAGSAGEMLSACNDWVKLDEHDADTARALLYDPVRAMHAGECVGAVMGISTTLLRLKFLCAPTDVSTSQLMRMVVSDMEQHPDQLHRTFDAVATEVMIGAWPCRN
jgi:hypothetical protein